MQSFNQKPFEKSLGPGLAFAMWVVVTLCITLMMIYNPYEKDHLNMVLGAVVIFIGLLPISHWLRQRTARHIPILAMYLLFYAFCFGMAGFVTPSNFMGSITVTESQYSVGLVAALVFMLFTLIAYKIAVSISYPKLAILVPEIAKDKNELIIFFVYPSLMFLNIFLKIIDFSVLSETVGSARLFSFIFCLHATWTNDLKRTARYWVLFGMLPIEFILFGGLSEGTLVGLLVYGQIVSITYIITRGRFPLLMVALVILSFGFLQPIKSQYRDVVWKSDQKIEISKKLLTLFDVATNYYGSSSLNNNSQIIFDEAYSRINHLHTTAAVIEDTPGISDFRYGDTLLPILTKWIPRLLWEDKPIENLGNRWAKNYNYVDVYDFSTSYNLPWLAEMYMNFGWYGIVSFGLAIGVILGGIGKGFLARANSSAGFAFGLLISSSFFFPESNISLQIGKLVTSVVATWLVVYFVRSKRSGANQFR